MKEIALPFSLKKPVLACGADMKGAFCLAAGKRAYLVDGFGDLADLANHLWYERAIAIYGARLGIRPQVVVCDLHPGYYSGKIGEGCCPAGGSVRLCRVQHHEAHIAAAIVEHAIAGEVIGVAFDGTGFGSDGQSWGGEFFAGTLRRLERIGHLAYVPMPGGDRVVAEPWRMAVSHLYRSLGARAFSSKLGLLRKVDRARLAAVREMIDRNTSSPLTSSAGRLFDAVGSLVFEKALAAKEAELPLALERIAEDACTEAYDFAVRSEKGMIITDPAPVIAGVAADLQKKGRKGAVAAKFHNAVARAIAAVVRRGAKGRRTKRVVLTGGVFQNGFLTARVTRLLAEKGFTVYRHGSVETNDHGIPVGQVAIAAARSRGKGAAGRVCA